MPAQATQVLPDAEDGGRVAEAETVPPAPADADADPSLEGIPREVIENVGAYGADCAGGCG